MSTSITSPVFETHDMSRASVSTSNIVWIWRSRSPVQDTISYIITHSLCSVNHVCVCTCVCVYVCECMCERLHVSVFAVSVCICMCVCAVCLCMCMFGTCVYVSARALLVFVFAHMFT